MDTDTGDNTMTDSPNDSVSAVASAGTYRAFVRALKAADLVNLLEGRGPVTVFPFTDAAFEAMGGDATRGFFSDTARLVSLLRSHIVSGLVSSAELMAAGGARLTALSGKILRVTTRGSELFVNGARVVRADVAARNGLIHVVDAVVLPAD
jgi:uncharacterized surface protein with fasciclin (FAS1) repeats